jgi:hypothetical protein
VTGDDCAFADPGELHWKGNDEYPVIEGLLAQFLLPGGPRRRGGSQELDGEASGDL